MIRITILLGLFLLGLNSNAQSPCYWQQEADYNIDFKLNPDNHQFTGSEVLTYTNNSPDVLDRVFYHLYFNAFQPGSAMDIRSLTIADADRRVGSRISKLKDDEIGYQTILSMSQNGTPIQWKVHGTVAEIMLNEPLEPGSTHEFALEFEGQVPLQVRRSGRDNKEGIEFSMTQWYPKIAEYDPQGWHAYEYVGREFHSPWGDYDVKLTMPANYVIAAGGVLQNPEEIGYGYSEKRVKHKKAKDKELTWHFKTENVIDFAWGADPDYVQYAVQVPNGPLVRYFYQPNNDYNDAWQRMINNYTIPLFTTMAETFGEYPYPEYSVIQGGDGGMEYPLATLITGNRSFESLYGVTSHELGHSWFQMMMASNEALYAWMDEGMTSFADAEVTKKVFNEEGNPHSGAINGYIRFVESGLNEPANQHSDYFNTNYAYGVAAYTKGELLLAQLKYIMGEEVFFDAMKEYYNEWRFKHPTPNDFIRVMEKESGLQLQWFMRQWLNTTRTIDYAVEKVTASQMAEGVSIATIESKGLIQVPVEITVEYKDGRPSELIYIPQTEMYGDKQFPASQNVKMLNAWNWVSPTYDVIIHSEASEIKSITIDAGGETADIDPKNNVWKK